MKSTYKLTFWCLPSNINGGDLLQKVPYSGVGLTIPMFCNKTDFRKKNSYILVPMNALMIEFCIIIIVCSFLSFPVSNEDISIAREVRHTKLLRNSIKDIQIQTIYYYCPSLVFYPHNWPDQTCSHVKWESWHCFCCFGKETCVPHLSLIAYFSFGNWRRRTLSLHNRRRVTKETLTIPKQFPYRSALFVNRLHHKIQRKQTIFHCLLWETQKKSNGSKMVSWVIFLLPVIIICIPPIFFAYIPLDTFNDCSNYFLWFFLCKSDNHKQSN